MRDFLCTAFVVLACAAAPLFAPQAWAQHGAFPDLAVLAVLHLAIQGTPERAALLGIAIGLARSGWTSEPTGLSSALYGSLGWSGAHFGRALFQDRVFVQMGAAAGGVVALRGVGAAAATLTVAGTPAANGTHGTAILSWLAGTLVAAGATALAAPFVFSILSGSRVLSRLEKRRSHDV